MKPLRVIGLLLMAGMWFRAVAGEGARNDATVQTHWAFLPVRRFAVPASGAHAEWAQGAVDRFLLEKLLAAGLQPSEPADPEILLRRACLVVTGLPPSPEQREAFLRDPSERGYARLIDSLLASPRFGERFAQFWLDLARYGDTDGFEVNTERPNAWPYRDYVIRAFNRDVPYDRFLREQLAGDAFGEDAATGFLVAAAALLPGQIGQDDASKRLARQDELNEIVSGAGQAMLGLSVGCARCHHHKFDPISLRDYYSMQAFFAGVRFGERPSYSPEAMELRAEAERWKRRAADIDRRLAEFEPMARVQLPPQRETSAKRNEERFAPLEARWVRFTIHDSNLHPALGLIEPCIDEFEIYGEAEPDKNLALATHGTRVRASGAKSSENHRLEFIHDGRYGNSRSWMSDEPGRGWVEFELPAPARISRIVWSRDREGMFQDRLPTAYSIEAGPSLESLSLVAGTPPLRVAVQAKQNTEKFLPRVARRIRLSIEACTSLEPCLDELEVFSAEDPGRNVALASAGATSRASSTVKDSPLHRLEHLNDGQYGNSRSWMSAETGKGWVEITFPKPERIQRVVWGRDREGKYEDRLATQYRVEIEDETGVWHWVAGSVDRKKPGSDRNGPAFSFAGLTPSEAKEAVQWLEERKQIQTRLQNLTAAQRVFAGYFTSPEPAKMLSRGDPEQPGEVVGPAVIAALGTLRLPVDAAEQERRLKFAEWVCDPSHPLTARVMANRLWQWIFGVGLVDTPSDFGKLGSKPSHPELLDWLAADFVDSGWSLKRLSRTLLLSSAFRQSSRVRPDAQKIDSENRLLWRFSSRRLEAEVIRDSMLWVNGRLDLKMGGPGFNFFGSRGGLNGFPLIESFSGDGLKRMVYAHKVRMERDAVFGVFDCPDAGQTAPKRRQSTTPVQALNLFNSRFTMEESDAYARRVATENSAVADVSSQVRQAYLLGFGRLPSAEESREARRVVEDFGLSTLCRAIYNSNEFLFLP